jgi:hypothetical protein
MESNLVKLLDEYAAIEDEITGLGAMHELAKRSVIPAEIQVQLDDIDTEHKGLVDAAQYKLERLKIEIKLAGLDAGATVKGNRYMAVYRAGKPSWDAAGLEGFMVAHPEIKVFRKDGTPSVALCCVAARADEQEELMRRLDEWGREK